nr:PAS domain-containing protein [Rhizobium sp. BK399]
MTQPVVVIDQNFCVTTANNAFIEAFGVDRDDILSENFFSLGNRQWDIPEHRATDLPPWTRGGLSIPTTTAAIS